MMREPPAGAAEAMTAEPTAQAADMSGAQRPTEVRAGTQMSAAHPATEVATTHPAQVSPAHSAAEMTTATATATTTATAAARPCVGCDASAPTAIATATIAILCNANILMTFPFVRMISTLIASAVRSRVAERRRRKRPIDHPARRLLDLVTAFARLRRSGPKLLGLTTQKPNTHGNTA